MSGKRQQRESADAERPPPNAVVIVGPSGEERGIDIDALVLDSGLRAFEAAEGEGPLPPDTVAAYRRGFEAGLRVAYEALEIGEAYEAGLAQSLGFYADLLVDRLEPRE